jgi:hypothetical protein
MTDHSPRAEIGDNSMVYYVETMERIESNFAQWSDIVLTEANAGSFRDFGKEVKDTFDAFEADRKERQAPFELEINKIRAAFRPMTDRMEKMRETLRDRLLAFMKSEQLRKDREAQAAAQAHAEAERLAREARAKMAEGPNAIARMDAEDAEHDAAMAAIEAEHAERQALARPSVSSASGMTRAMSMRTTWGVKVIDGPKLVRHYAKNPEMIALAEKIAAKESRALKGAINIPGVEPKAIESAA